MRYLAIILLSVVALLRAAGSSAAVESPPPVLAPVHAATSTDAFDGPLLVVLGGALIALQLRRRQKSLRSPRTLYG
ncbi:MAG TPA: hypothetical protein VMF52_00445 [Steroidobacteraceae bacterium]|nr:hypothetical protein [Steroidobacteraceae bacterium]